MTPRHPTPFSGRTCAACLNTTQRPLSRRASAAAKQFLPFLLFIALPIGCAENKPTTQPASWTDQAQADPADFNPQMDNPNISGGDIGHFDKNAFDKDMNDVLNP